MVDIPVHLAIGCANTGRHATSLVLAMDLADRNVRAPYERRDRNVATPYEAAVSWSGQFGLETHETARVGRS